MTFAFPFLALLAGYLVGSLSFAVIVSRAMGLADPRSYGSGNPGATNVLRSGSKPAALLTLALDAVKGVVPVLAARWAAARYGLGGDAVDWCAALAGIGAFLGHLWPVYFRFKGGKGVATAAGVLLAMGFLAGSGAALRDLLLALRSEADLMGRTRVGVFLPDGHPSRGDLEETGYDFEAEPDRMGYYSLRLQN